ncbi:MAG: twin-arginine translocase subunit TatC [Planctomycetota bacterium]
MTELRRRLQDEGEMSFGDHLEELRSRLVRSLYATLLCFIVVFYFHQEVLRVVIAPYLGVANELRMSAVLQLIKPTDAFFSYMKVSIVVALLVAAPVWIWQAWSFVSVGLYRNERKWVFRYAPLMIGLFTAGVAFGYSVLIPIGLKYLLSFRDPTVLQNWIGLNDYLAFFMALTLVLGLTFQLPVVMALLARLDIVDIDLLREKRRHFILGAFVVSALLTPPDAVTQILMAIPLMFLYEFGILLSWLGLGSERPAVNWSLWRKRGLIGLALLALAYFAQDRVVAGYRGRLVTQKVQVASQADGQEAVPYMQLFKECEFEGFEPKFAFQLQRLEDEEFWIVGSEKKACPVKVAFKSDRLTLTSRVPDTGEAIFMLAASTQSVRARRLFAADGKDTVAFLVTALEDAFDAEAPSIEKLLAGLVGKRPDGVSSFVEDEDAKADAARSGWRKWYDAHPDWMYEDKP